MIPKKIFITYNDDAHIKKGEIDALASVQGVIDTASSVKKAIEERGVCPVLVPLRDATGAFLESLRHGRPDMIFNLVEGAFGLSSMEMSVAGLYELFNFRYTGSGALTLGICLNKGMSKDILSARGIPTSKYVVISNFKSQISNLRSLSFPLIVKPLKEDAGLGVDINSIVHDAETLKGRVEYIHEVFKQPAIAEEYIDGREFNVSVIGNENPMALPISEIDFSGLPAALPKIVGYEAKWVTTSLYYENTVPVCPAHISKSLEEDIKALAVNAYRALDCRDYARVDVRMGSDNVPKVLEVNPNPDISPDAGIARSASAAGLSYSDIIWEIIGFAVKRHED